MFIKGQEANSTGNVGAEKMVLCVCNQGAGSQRRKGLCDVRGESNNVPPESGFLPA